MYHSIIFGTKDTWADWYLIPSSRPVIDPPEPKTKFVDIPGADWHIDLTTSLTGDVAYGPRTGSIDFIVDNGFLSDYDHTKWASVYSEIMNYLHGKYMKAILEDDPSYYYEGRFSVNSWKSEEKNSTVTIDYTVSPYKYERFSSLEDWEWDSFNFESGIIREYKDLKVDKRMTFVILGRRMAVTPSFIVKSTDGKGMKLTFNGTTYNLPDNDSKNASTRIVNLRTVEGKNTLTFTGNGTVSIDYRGGCL